MPLLVVLIRLGEYAWIPRSGVHEHETRRGFSRHLKRETIHNYRGRINDLDALFPLSLSWSLRPLSAVSYIVASRRFAADQLVVPGRLTLSNDPWRIRRTAPSEHRLTGLVFIWRWRAVLHLHEIPKTRHKGGRDAHRRREDVTARWKSVKISDLRCKHRGWSCSLFSQCDPLSPFFFSLTGRIRFIFIVSRRVMPFPVRCPPSAMNRTRE